MKVCGICENGLNGFGSPKLYINICEHCTKDLHPLYIVVYVMITVAIRLSL